MKFGIQPDRSGFLWFHRVSDIFIPIFVLCSVVFYLNIVWQDRYTLIGILGGLIFVIASQSVGIYSSWRGRPLFSSFKLILSAWALTWSILIILAFLFKDSASYSRLAVSIWAIATPIVLIIYRTFIRYVLSYYRSKGLNSKKIAIIGAGKVGKDIAEIISCNKWLGYQVTCFLDDNSKLLGQKINQTPVVSSTGGILQTIQSHHIDEIYICLPQRTEEKIKDILNELTDSTVIVKFVPDLFAFDLMHAKWSELKGYPVISVYDTPLTSSTQKFIKRVEDITLSIIILILVSPLLLWIAYKVKKSSPGAIIFKQKRYGINGKEIKVYKFRSMTTQDNGNTVKQAQKGDDRITEFGGFIRKTSLDELPQFINVLQGRMSIVGPRPHAIAHNEEYRKLIPKYMQRHIVKPGITGWAQVNGWRGETDTLVKMEKRIEFDLHYINSWSIWLDIKIIFLTVFKGFINKNAY